MLRFLVVALVAAFLVFGSPAPTQESPSNAPATSGKQSTPPAHGRITGTIFCTDTHKPARGALVLLDPAPSVEREKSSAAGESAYTRVADDGTYVLDDVSPGNYVISAVLPGYLAPFAGAAPAAANNSAEVNTRKGLPPDGHVSVHSDKTTTVHISLERGAVVSGRVLYADGSPAIQVFVNVEDVNANLKPDDRTAGIDVVARSILIHPAPITDDLGRFRISGIAPGSYHIVVIQSSSTMPGNGDTTFVPGFFTDFKILRTYSGDTMHRKAAKQYELRDEEEVSGVQITLPIDALHSVRGLITAEDGRPVTRATITLTDIADDTLTLHGDMEDDGTFNFARVPSGSYKLEATNAEIGKLPGNLSPASSTRFIYRKMTNSFADGSTSVIVKDSDVSNIHLTLKEIPLPPNPKNDGSK